MKLILYEWNTHKFPETRDKGKPFWDIVNKIDYVKFSYPRTLSMLLKRARRRGCHQANDEIGCSTIQAAPTHCRTKIRSATLSQGAASTGAVLHGKGLATFLNIGHINFFDFGVPRMVRNSFNSITISPLKFVGDKGG